MKQSHAEGSHVCLPWDQAPAALPGLSGKFEEQRVALIARALRSELRKLENEPIIRALRAALSSDWPFYPSKSCSSYTLKNRLNPAAAIPVLRTLGDGCPDLGRPSLMLFLSKAGFCWAWFYEYGRQEEPAVSRILWTSTMKEFIRNGGLSFKQIPAIRVQLQEALARLVNGEAHSTTRS